MGEPDSSAPPPPANEPPPEADVGKQATYIHDEPDPEVPGENEKAAVEDSADKPPVDAVKEDVPQDATETATADVPAKEPPSGVSEGGTEAAAGAGENATAETPVGNAAVETPVDNAVAESPVDHPTAEGPVDAATAETPADNSTPEAPVDSPAADHTAMEPPHTVPVETHVAGVHRTSTGAALVDGEAATDRPSTGAALAHGESAPAPAPVAEVPSGELLALPSPPSALSSVSSLSVDSDDDQRPVEESEQHLADDPAPPEDTAPPPGPEGSLDALEDPLVYEATQATVSAVLGGAAELLESGALSDMPPEAVAAAAELLHRALDSARRHLESAAGSVKRLLPLGVRLAEEVITVPQWRAVERSSRQCARGAIHQALLELRLPEDRRHARRLLRALRRRPAKLWADLALNEADEKLTRARQVDRYPGADEELDAGREAETALLAAYRAAVRAQGTEPVPPAPPLPPAAGLDPAARMAVVHDVVKSWRYSIRWRYCVDYLRTEEEPLLSRHIYQVRFSVPEQHQPIPRPVAYVFFVLTESKIKPEEPIQMYYMTETSRLRHVPGKVIFQEKWLIDIINVKLKFWREIKF